MARQTTVRLVDDLDGTPADCTVPFAFDGRDYVLDLSAANAAALRDCLAPYIAAARRARGRHRPRSTPSLDVPPRTIRRWAYETGREVSAYGRIPAALRAEYAARDRG